MTSGRRRIGTIGRTQYQLRMPNVNNVNPDGLVSNLREIERWGNALPMPQFQTKMPAHVFYYPDPMIGDGDYPAVTLDLNEILAEYADDVVPTGTWLCYMTVNFATTDIAEAPHLNEAVGWSLYANVATPDITVPSVHQTGYSSSDVALETVVDIDFVTPEFTTEYRLPIMEARGSVSSMGIVTIQDVTSNTVSLAASAALYYIEDPLTGGTILEEQVRFQISAWMFRLGDAYDIPNMREDITPP